MPTRQLSLGQQSMLSQPCSPSHCYILCADLNCTYVYVFIHTHSLDGVAICRIIFYEFETRSSRLSNEYDHRSSIERVRRLRAVHSRCQFRPAVIHFLCHSVVKRIERTWDRARKSTNYGSWSTERCQARGKRQIDCCRLLSMMRKMRVIDDCGVNRLVATPGESTAWLITSDETMPR